MKYKLFFFLFLVSIVEVQASPVISSYELTGDWGGLRKGISDLGITLDSRYIFEIWQIEKKFKEQPASFYIQNIDISLIFEFEKLFGIKGGRMLFDLQGMNGENPNFNIIRSFQGLSNIEAWDNFLIYQLWYQQSLCDERLSFLFGLFDLNSEFDLSFSKKNFVTPAHGIGTDFSLTGKLGPSIYPVTSLAFRTRYKFSEKFKFSLAFFDALPGDTNNLHGTHIVLKNSDGLLVVGEASLFENLFPGDIKEALMKLGFWYYTDRYTHPVSGIKQWGVYVHLQKTIFYEKSNTAEGLSASLRLGYSDTKTNFTDVFLAAALEYKGLIPARQEDYCGLAFAYSDLSEYFYQRAFKSECMDCKYDLNLEFFYKFRVLNFLYLQPVFSYFVSPALNPDFERYFAGGLRLYVQI